MIITHEVLNKANPWSQAYDRSRGELLVTTGRPLVIKPEQGVTSLGVFYKVLSNFTALKCTTLEDIGSLSWISGDADFRGCTALRSLAGLSVGGVMKISPCHLLALPGVADAGAIEFGDNTSSLGHFVKLIAHWTRYYRGSIDLAALDVLRTKEGTVHHTMARAALENQLQQGDQHD